MRTMDDGIPDAELDDHDSPVDAEHPAMARVGALGERPEADALEQATLVRTEQAVHRPVVRDDVPEADAWEQSIEEPIDDDRI